jgi:hypothetical protein
MRWYVYGIAAAPALGLREGVAERPVAAEAEGDLWLILSPWTGEPPRGEAPTVVAHERVVEAAMAGGAVLPFRFGTVVDEVDCREFVRRYQERIHQQLQQVAGHVEVSLKLIEPPAPAAGGSMEKAATGLEYLLRRQRAVARDEERERRAREIITRVEERLAPWIAARHHRLVPNDRVIAAITHLIPREALGAWSQAVTELRPQLHGLDCLASGPWPPYHFAEVIPVERDRHEPHSGTAR